MQPSNVTQKELTPPDTEALRIAFRHFEQVSVDLADSYRQLESRVVDLTDELEAARSERMMQLAETERLAARLKNLLEALPGGVIVLDGEGRVREFNPVALDLLGVLQVGELWREVVARTFAPQWDDGHDISLVSGRRVNLSTQALRGEPGQILLFKDVTETRTLQDQLARHKRLAAMGEMAAALAHQVRTPLASAILHLSNLRRPQLDESLRNRMSEQALDRVKHLERLVADMLLFARGGAFDAADMTIDELVEGLKADLKLIPAEFEVSIDNRAGDSHIRANRDALLSALRNLIENAVHACEGRGRMWISTASEGADVVELRFRDNGPGIPAAVRDTLFEPFFTTRAQGTGLGLAVTQSVVRAHGGDIMLEPQQEEAGTVFTVRLPRQVNAAAGDRRRAAEITRKR